LSFVVQAGGDETVDELCDRFRDTLDEGCTVAPDTPVVCDVAGLGPADLATIHALARLQLLARRRGRSIKLRGPSRFLLELIELVGLGESLRADRNPPG